MLSHLIGRIKSMPHWLGFIALCGFIFSPLLILTPFLPGAWTDAETGEAVSKDAVWESGVFYVTATTGICLIFFSVCIFRRLNCVRYLIPLTFLSLALYFYIRPDTRSSTDMYGTLIWAGLSGWYLLLKSSVKKYFKPETEQAMGCNRRQGH